MFCTDPIIRIAKKLHKCTYCGETIFQSEQYLTWKSIDRGDGWYTSKMHIECHADFAETGGGEYTPFSGKRQTEDIA